MIFIVPEFDALSETDQQKLQVGVRHLARAFKLGKIGASDITGLLSDFINENKIYIEPKVELDVPPLPTTAPRRYKIRSKTKASEFFLTTYGPWIEAGVLFRPHLGKLDASLLNALTYEFRGNAEALREILPLKTDQVNLRMLQAVTPVDPRERNMLSQYASKIQRRQPKR